MKYIPFPHELYLMGLRDEQFDRAICDDDGTIIGILTLKTIEPKVRKLKEPWTIEIEGESNEKLA